LLDSEEREEQKTDHTKQESQQQRLPKKPHERVSSLWYPAASAPVHGNGDRSVLEAFHPVSSRYLVHVRKARFLLLCCWQMTAELLEPEKTPTTFSQVKQMRELTTCR
jgi:hypothetical protein